MFKFVCRVGKVMGLSDEQVTYANTAKLGVFKYVGVQHRALKLLPFWVILSNSTAQSRGKMIIIL